MLQRTFEIECTSKGVQFLFNKIKLSKSAYAVLRSDLSIFFQTPTTKQDYSLKLLCIHAEHVCELSRPRILETEIWKFISPKCFGYCQRYVHPYRVSKLVYKNSHSEIYEILDRVWLCYKIKFYHERTTRNGAFKLVVVHSLRKYII